MLLYHGSNVEVRQPRIIPSDRRLDFGTGFYLTSSRAQAERWAELTVRRRQAGGATLSVFEFDEGAVDRLNTLVFHAPDESWLRYTANNRRNASATDAYDIVIGPVADDRTAPVIAAYYAGIYDEAETIKRLLPQKLRDQYAFKTVAAIEALSLCEVIAL